MNEWDVDEHEQWSEKVRSQCFCPPLLDKNRNYEGFSLNMLKTGTAPEGDKEATALLLGNLIDARHKKIDNLWWTFVKKNCISND